MMLNQILVRHKNKDKFLAYGFVVSAFADKKACFAVGRKKYQEISNLITSLSIFNP